MEERRKTEPSQAATASKYLGVGLTWALSTGLFMYLGTVLDRRLGTEPWLTLVGAFVGGSAGFWYMWRHLVIEPRRRQSGRDGPKR